MKPYSYEDVPNLDYDSFVILLQSTIDAVNSEQVFLHTSINAIDTFEGLHWIDLGLDQGLLDNIVKQFRIMFNFDAKYITLSSKIDDFISLMLDAWAKNDGVLSFCTVGPDGEQKIYTHSIIHLKREVASLVPFFEHVKSALITVPLTHVYGFTYGLLLPLALKIPIRFAVPICDALMLAMKPHDMIVGIPLLWASMAKKVMSGEIYIEGKDIVILSSTCAMPAHLLHLLRHNGFKTWEIFGSTELGGIAYRSNPDDAYSLYPYLSRCDNSLVKLNNEFPDGSNIEVTLLDTVSWMDQRKLRPIARRDNAVQVAGHSVYPAYVASVIEDYQDVKLCLVRMMTPNEGYKLKAFVVPYEGVNIEKLRAGLAIFLNERLDDYQFPGSFTFGISVPVGTFGKPYNW